MSNHFELEQSIRNAIAEKNGYDLNTTFGLAQTYAALAGIYSAYISEETLQNIASRHIFKEGE